MTKTAVIGAGSWGTALAVTLAKNGNEVKMWGREEDGIMDMQKERRNKLLPKVHFPDGITCTDDMQDALTGAKVAVFAVPAQIFRGVFTQALDLIEDDAIVVNVAKGIEQGTLKRMSEVAEEIMGDRFPYVCLSGPSHAEEVGIGSPTTVVVTAGEDTKTAEKIQDLFMSDRFRVYTGKDMIGVELGGSLKNIIALGAGISDGIGYGDNAKAALMTRGMAEMTRLGVALGAKPETFFGLTGMGDLIVTCTSMHSRNRRCGIMMGEGKKSEEAVAAVGMVVEGITTVEGAYELAKKNNVEMPITEQIYKVIHDETNAKNAVDVLMKRARKAE